MAIGWGFGLIMQQQQQIVVLRGGLDIVTQPMEVPPGSVIAAENYESEARGYRRNEGYEVFDGHEKPSKASYSLLNFDSGSAAISEGETVTGDTSGATGVVLEDATITSGTVGGGDAAGTIALYNVSGTFVDDEGLEVSSSNVATADGDAVYEGASTDVEHNAFLESAIEKRRAVITEVPGSGAVLGVATYKGDVYAWRNNSGGTAAVMHKATASGWVAQSFGHTITFNSGSAEFAEGETLTGGTSGATATIERVTKTSGAWDGSGAGYLVLSGVSGTFSASETITSASGAASAIATQDAVTLPAGGKYRAVSNNFYGASNLRRLYIVNGEGYGLEWDGSVLAPIRTGLPESIDKPKFVAVHSNHLLLGYDGGHINVSGTGLPLSFDAINGAAEIGFGEDLTGMKSSTKTATVITGRNKIGYLTGNNSSDFSLQDVSEDSGAVTDTLEVVGEPYFLDDRGVRSLSAADTFGDWSIGTATRLVEPLLASKKQSGLTPVGALRVRSKDQYRLYYSDGSGLTIYFGRENPENMPFRLEFVPTCVFSGEESNGEEILFAGGDDGFVYQIDAGTSANGEAMSAYIRTSFLHQGAPNTHKRYHRALLDVADGGALTSLQYSSDYDYGNPNLPSGTDASLDIRGGGGFWGATFWETFYWDATAQAQAAAELYGIGRNVTIAIINEATYEQPHTLTSLTINFTPRRTLR